VFIRLLIDRTVIGLDLARLFLGELTVQDINVFCDIVTTLIVDVLVSEGVLEEHKLLLVRLRMRVPFFVVSERTNRICLPNERLVGSGTYFHDLSSFQIRLATLWINVAMGNQVRSGATAYARWHL